MPLVYDEDYGWGYPYEEPAEHIPLCSNVALGLTLGQHRNPPALAIVEAEWRKIQPGVDEWDKHFKVRHLKQLEVRSYPAIADRLQEVANDLTERNPRWELHTYVDITGLGQPVFELLRKRVSKLRLRPVTFNHGDQRVEVDKAEVRLGKAYLVTRLQTLLQTDRLHLGRSKHGDRLARELLDYQLDTHDNANDTYGAFQVGSRDQLVTCLGLALNNDIWCEIPRPPEKRKVKQPWRRPPTLRERIYGFHSRRW